MVSQEIEIPDEPLDKSGIMLPGEEVEDPAVKAKEDADLADQILTLIETKLRDSIERSRTREASVVQWKLQAQNEAKPTVALPFIGASEAYTALVPTLISTIRGQIASPVLSSAPMVLMQPIGDEPFVGATSKLERFTHNRLVTLNFRPALPEWVDASATTGEGIMAVEWDENLGEVSFRVVDTSDLFPYPAEVPRYEDAQFIAERQRIWPVEMRRRAASGKYIKEAVESVLTAGRDLTLTDNIRELSQRMWGSHDVDSPVVVYRVVARLDMDGDDEDELVEFDMTLQPPTLLTAITPYRYKHGRQYLHSLKLFNRMPRSSFRFGQTVCEIAAEQQRQQSCLRRQRTDVTTLGMAVVTLVRKGCKWMRDFRPGGVAEVDSHHGDLEGAVRTVSLRPPGGEIPMVSESEIINEARELLGVTAMQVGASPDVTLGVAQAAMAGSSSRMDDAYASLEEAMTEVVETMLAHYAEFRPDAAITPSSLDVNTVQGVSPEALFAAMTKDIWTLSKSIVLAAADKAMNPVVRSQMAEKQLIFSKNSPIIKSSPALEYRAEAEYLRATGEPNPERRLGTEAEWVKRAEEAGGPPPPQITVQHRADEILTLANALDNGSLTPDQYLAAAKLAAAAAALMPQKIPGVRPVEMADNPAGPGPATAVNPPVEPPAPSTAPPAILPAPSEMPLATGPEDHAAEFDQSVASIGAGMDQGDE